jgi:hypothetical protein
MPFNIFMYGPIQSEHNILALVGEANKGLGF